MSRIFLSHSSKNNPEAIALRDWLVGEGWDDLFLDLDPERGIVAGERWERALHEAASRCDAVLFLVSRAWLDSAWCRKEFHLAHRLNKRILGILIEDIPVQELPEELTATWQLVNLASGGDHRVFRAVLPDTGKEQHVTLSQSGLTRLKNGLNKAGLDPRFFAWPPEHDPKRPPYRGMRPLEAEDAGIFFGREAPIVDLLATLRGLREMASPRFLVILGASGSGKSSFLRAGILPRLLRDDRNFLPLPIIRPEQAVLNGDNGMLRCLEKTFDQYQIPATRKQLRDALDAGSHAMLPLLVQLADKAKPPAMTGESATRAPTLVFSIDQGEELFLAEGALESQRFFELLRELALADTPNLLILFTIRSDSYERLQTAKALEGVRQEPYSLPPMPRGAYQSVVEGPAARLASTKRPLKIEPKLTESLLQDIDHGGGKDALPLLAFTLERLYIEYGGGGTLRLDQYQEMGGIKGAIEAAVERAFKAAEHDPSLPRDRNALLLLIRRGLIPWLAGIDPETQAPRRRVALMAEIPAEVRPLIRHLIEQRLLATDRVPENGEITIEPAHEALLRQWGLLQGWLQEDLAILAILEGVQRGTRDWEANNRDSAWLNHIASRLESTQQLLQREDLTHILTSSDWAYLMACREQDRDRKLKEEERAKIAEKFIQSQMVQSQFISEKASLLLEKNDPELALAIVLEGLPTDSMNPNRPIVSNTLKTFGKAIVALRQRHILSGHTHAVLFAVFSPSGDQVVTASSDKTVRLWDAIIGTEIAELHHEGEVCSALFSPSGDRVISASCDRTVRLWNARNGNEIAVFRHEGAVCSALFSPSGDRVVSASRDKTARLWNAHNGNGIAVFHHEGEVCSASFSPSGDRVVSASYDKTVRLWNAHSGNEIAVLHHEGAVCSASFSPSGDRIVSASNDKSVRLWDANSGAAIAVFYHEGAVCSASFSLSGDRIVSASNDKSVRLWDTNSGVAIAVFHHEGAVCSASFSPSGDRVISASHDKTVRLWSALNGNEIAVFHHEGEVCSASFSPSGDQIVSSSRDKTARLWNAFTDAKIAVLQHEGYAVSFAKFSPSGDRILTSPRHNIVLSSLGEDRTAQLWDAHTGTEITKFSHSSAVCSASFSPSGDRIVSTSRDDAARLWDGNTGSEIALLQHDGRVDSADFSPTGDRVITWSKNNKNAFLWDGHSGDQIAVLHHTGYIDSVFFSTLGDRIISSTTLTPHEALLWNGHNGTKIATLQHGVSGGTAFGPLGDRAVSASGCVAWLWDVRNGEEISRLGKHMGRINSVGYSTSCDRIVTCVEEETVAQLWDAKTGTKVAVLDGHKGGILSVAFSPSGDRIITESEDHNPRLWDARSGIEIAVLKESFFTAFSPLGDYIFTASNDKTAQLWNGRNGKEVAVLKHSEAVNYASFSASGDRVITWGQSGRTVSLWDIRTGVRIAELPHGAFVASATFSPLGDRIVTKHNDGTAQLWMACMIPPVDVARLTVMRHLTAQECQELFLEDHSNAIKSTTNAATHHRAIANQTKRGGGAPKNLKKALFHHAVASRLFTEIGDEYNASLETTCVSQLSITLLASEIDNHFGGSWPTLLQGAAQGSPHCHAKLGRLYERGDGIPRDLKQALFHYAIAARLFTEIRDDDNAAVTVARRGSLARSLPPNEVAPIWPSVLKWKPNQQVGELMPHTKSLNERVSKFLHQTRFDKSRMNLVEWDSTLHSHRSIDVSHRMMLEHINDFYLNMMVDEGGGEFSCMFPALLDTIRRHFKIEEDFMGGVDYYDPSEHQLHHTLLLNRLKELTASVETNKENAVDLFSECMVAWIREHNAHDGGFAELFKALKTATWVL